MDQQWSKRRRWVPYPLFWQEKEALPPTPSPKISSFKRGPTREPKKKCFLKVLSFMRARKSFLAKYFLSALDMKWWKGVPQFKTDLQFKCFTDTRVPSQVSDSIDRIVAGKWPKNVIRAVIFSSLPSPQRVQFSKSCLHFPFANWKILVPGATMPSTFSWFFEDFMAVILRAENRLNLLDAGTVPP